MEHSLTAQKNSNNDAQKNVSIISQKELNSGTSVFVRNIYDINKKYTLELIPGQLPMRQSIHMQQLKWNYLSLFILLGSKEVHKVTTSFVLHL